jgi:hypothetical protein
MSSEMIIADLTPAYEPAFDDECINAGVTDYPPPGDEDIRGRIQHRLEKVGDPL